MAGERRKLHLLLVDDQRLFLNAFGRLHARSERPDLALRTASSLEGAIAALDAGPTDIVLFDLCMPTLGHALALVDAVFDRAPLPRLLGMSGRAVGPQGYADLATLGRLGVRTIYDKGDVRLWNSTIFDRIVEDASSSPPALDKLGRAYVGEVGLVEARDQLAESMCQEAMARAGSTRGAARLLNVSRQAVQKRERVRSE